ncbi:synergin gamma-like isoform X1 [Homarus americanus]|uniref:synergin gamma-like isoform X1 n=1 Tax=Homarus americanus TaxID=6706 RepID=UPI001C45077B|nr:synergin gamma-like isoform X1 [Homarus americanus]
MSHGAHNRPVRPGHMPTNGMGQGGAWVPGMNMPPLGFGVVPQQPGGIMMAPAQVGGQQVMPQGAHITNWHQQQFMAAKQMGISSAPVGVQPLSQQQHNQLQQQHFNSQQQYQHHLQQQQQHLQQQWVEVHKKAAVEQKKLYEQLIKQRQFDEQKMRLKAFSSSKKAGVSADSMIENILGTKETLRMRSPPQPKKVPTGEGVVNQGPSQIKQGTPVDWSKLNNMNTLFGVTQERGAIPPVAGLVGQTATQPLDDSSEITLPGVVMDPGAQMSLGKLDGCTGGPPVLPVGPPGSSARGIVGIGNNGSAVPLVESGGNMAVGKHRGEGKALPLPGWLSDKSCVPAVYQQAGSLVEGKDGWVDTSRAYMLLMKTGLPAPFLGVLWEMVNQTQPGQLLTQEFTALLALVALVQNGQAISNRDILSTVKEPILPIIDHPALLPLVQDYIQQRQQQQQQSENSQESGVAAMSSEGGHQPPSKSNDDDEFDDFVSGPNQGGTMNMFQSASVMSQQLPGATGQLPPPTILPPGPGGTSQLSQKPMIPSVDKIKRMNLPKVGFSPELSPSTSFDHTCDDEFDDFQSATATSGAASSTRMTHAVQPGFPLAHGSQHVAPVAAAEPSQAAPVLLQPEKSGGSGDKYAVFRELEAPSEGTSDPNFSQSQSHCSESTAEPSDESFGDFCSSEPVSLTNTLSSLPPMLPSVTSAGPGTNNNSPVSFEVYSTPPEMVPETSVDNYFEADFGGAFTSATSTQSMSNYADIHEAMKRAEIEQKKKEVSDWSDPFGEFEEAPSNTSLSSAAGVLPVPQLSLGISDEEDEDFGDFMGPDTGIVEPRSNRPFPSLSENLGETQSVASLELPGLEMTVGLQPSETRGSGSNQSPDLFMQPRSDIGGVEDHLRTLSLDSSSVFGESPGNGGGTTTSGVGGATQPVGSSSVMDSFNSGLVDKYSIIREEASKNTHDEAHTGSWQRCLECSVGLLEEARDTLSKLTQTKLKTQVLVTSQMQDYLANLQEVWFVCKRISSSSQQVTTSSKVDDLLTRAKSLWGEISAASDDSVVKAATLEGDNQMGDNEVCGVCLSGGGNKLTYGGHSYHPPCANLWLNCVDLLLPSLTPVTLL